MKKFETEQVNEILQSIVGFIFLDNELEIDEEIVEDSDEILSDLLGYKVKVKTDGEHVHDGQVVEYKFKFKSPEGKKTKYVTDMNLVNGWDTSYPLELE